MTRIFKHKKLIEKKVLFFFVFYKNLNFDRLPKYDGFGGNVNNTSKQT